MTYYYMVYSKAMEKTELKAKRMSLSLTQGQFAAELCVSIKAVQFGEQGLRLVPCWIERMVTLCQRCQDRGFHGVH